VFKRLLEGLFHEPGMTYESARDLANNDDPQIRAQLAARTDVKPEILYYLAEDPSPDVRRAIATNTTAPRQADLLLAKDEDPSVRYSLAGKIAALTPTLSNEEHSRLQKLAYEVLEILARDQVTRVRQIIAETLKDIANAPPHVIRQLARDAELVVCAPVLEHSPVLTDEDLLDIIAQSPVKGALAAIARRAGLSEAVSDVVCHSTDEEAIAILLANPSAQVREETLDYLVERAVDIEGWHSPLVRRTKLTSRAAARMARYVADNLLEVLASRDDLDSATVEAVTSEVRRRLDTADIAAKKPPPTPRAAEAAAPRDVDGALNRAQRMKKTGKLNEVAVLRAVESRDLQFVHAALSVMSELPFPAVVKIFATRSAKGIMAASWKAGLSAQAALVLQSSVASISPRDILGPTDEGRYPLTREDMLWQLDFFSDLAGT
jgi:uncharacterized protein (DUF2336 family)